MVVENKPGAQGLLATDFVAKSKPDGYTIMITPASSTLATAPHLFKKLPFDPIKDFAAVTQIITLSFTFAVDAAAAAAHDPRVGCAPETKPGTASTARSRTAARSRPSCSRRSSA